MSFSLKGKLHKKFPTKQIKETFRKREFVMEYIDNPQYPQYVAFQLIQDKCDLLDSFEPGQMLEVSFNLRGREWRSPDGEMKYFNSLDAWRIAPQQSAPNPAEAPLPTPPDDALDVSDLNDSDDLPF